MAGRVRLNGQPADKAGSQVRGSDELEVIGGAGYVSRGGQKLAGALDTLGVDPTGRTALDAGASTGGFTDCLLQRGAKRVYAVDVGYGQLAWKLRSDDRVVVMERTNVRHLEPLPETVDLVTADLSFISLALVLPAILRSLSPAADLLLMVKPQFEVGRDQVGKGGVVRDDALRAAAADKIAEAGRVLGLREVGRGDSAVPGPKGNREIFLHLVWRRH
jgi:23S rRNA (cytidine1920-2'-O)/16S rRNA (cytidine1409-2'-O)-methyltransferase